MPKKQATEIVLLPPVDAVTSAFDEYKQLRPVALEKGGRVENVLPTGSLILDLILGGGLQRGRIAVFLGPEASGKTTLMLTLIASSQRLGIPCVFYDCEHSADCMYMHYIGVDLDFKIRSGGKRVPGFFYTQPGPGEEVYKHMFKTLRRMQDVDPERPGPPTCLFVVDSFAAMYSESEDVEKSGKGGVGRDARMHSVWLRRLKGLLRRKGVLLVVTNQIRFNINMKNPQANPETEPGGNAMRFYADYKIRVSARKRDEEDKGGLARQHIWIRTQKNKCFPPFRACEHEIILGRGLDKAQDALEFLKAIGKVETRVGRHRILLGPFETPTTLKWAEFRKVTESDEFRSYALKLLQNEKVYGAYFKTAKYYNYSYDAAGAVAQEESDDAEEQSTIPESSDEATPRQVAQRPQQRRSAPRERQQAQGGVPRPRLRNPHGQEGAPRRRDEASARPD